MKDFCECGSYGSSAMCRGNCQDQGLCSAGDQVFWHCVNSSKNLTCEGDNIFSPAPPRINGITGAVCGPYHGHSYYIDGEQIINADTGRPITGDNSNFCSSGTLEFTDTEANDGTWNWKCKSGNSVADCVC